MSVFTITGLQSGFTYQVWAKYISSTQAFFSQLQNTTTIAGCGGTAPAPTTNAIPSHCAQVNVSWPRHALALATAGYRLYWSKQGSTGYNVVAVTGTSYTISGLSLNDNYTIWYKVLCTGGAQITSALSSYSTCGGAARTLETENILNEYNLSGDFKNLHFEEVDIREVALQTENTLDEGMQLVLLENKKNTVSFSEDFVNIWPNPSSDFLQIQLTTVQDSPCIISILGIDGRAIQYLKLAANELGTRIETRFLPDGIYLLRIEKEEAIYYKKFVIQH